MFCMKQWHKQVDNSKTLFDFFGQGNPMHSARINDRMFEMTSDAPTKAGKLVRLNFACDHSQQ